MSNSQFQAIKEQVLAENPTKAELLAYGGGISAPIKSSMVKNEIAETITTFLIEQRMGNAPPEEKAVQAHSPQVGKDTQVNGQPTEQTLAGVVRNDEQTTIRHLVRLLVPDISIAITNWRYMTAFQLQEYVAENFFQQGYSLKFVKRLGAEETGHNILLVFEETKDSHSEIIIKLQPIGGMTGFQADDWISSYVDQGWELFHIDGVGWTEEGVNVFWVLVR